MGSVGETNARQQNACLSVVRFEEVCMTCRVGYGMQAFTCPHITLGRSPPKNCKSDLDDQT